MSLRTCLGRLPVWQNSEKQYSTVAPGQACAQWSHAERADFSVGFNLSVHKQPVTSSLLRQDSLHFRMDQAPKVPISEQRMMDCQTEQVSE